MTEGEKNGRREEGMRHPPSVIPDIFSRESIFRFFFSPSVRRKKKEGWIPDY